MEKVWWSNTGISSIYSKPKVYQDVPRMEHWIEPTAKLRQMEFQGLKRVQR